MLIEPITPIDSRPKDLILMMTTNEIAVELDTTPRTLRKFLRSEGQGVGKGSRYALPSTKRDLNSLHKRFSAWQEAIAAKKGSEDAPDAIEGADDAPADA